MTADPAPNVGAVPPRRSRFRLHKVTPDDACRCPRCHPEDWPPAGEDPTTADHGHSPRS